MPVPPPVTRPGQSILYDRVWETTTTSGTGTVTLLGSVLGYQSFAAVGDGNYCYYCIADQSGSNWEIGIGQYTASGTTLSRAVVLSSSNSGSLVSFSTNTKDVFIPIPATIAMRGLFAGTASVTVSNTLTETSLIPADLIGSASLGANYLYPGKTVRLILRGYISTAASPGTLTLKFKVGGTAIASTGAVTPPGSLSSVYWELAVDLVCYTTGAAGQSWSQGRLLVAPTTLSPTVAGLVTTAAVTLDTTGAHALDVSATWGTASASNSLTSTHFSIESVT